MRDFSRMMRRLVGLGLALGWVSACQTTAQQSQVYRIRVETGDTLAAIARKYDTTWERIAQLNGLSPGKPLTVGAILRVAPGPGGLIATGEGPDEPEGDEAESLSSGTGSEGLLFGGGVNSGGLEWPIYGTLSSRYGMRGRRFHHGIDIRTKTGLPVVCSAPGVVEFAGRQHGYGRVVIVRHQRFKTLYAHLKSVSVKAGENLGRASEIGSSGSSGNSTGPHLHFEIRDFSNHSIDPLTLIAKDKLMTAGN